MGPFFAVAVTFPLTRRTEIGPFTDSRRNVPESSLAETGPLWAETLIFAFCGTLMISDATQWFPSGQCTPMLFAECSAVICFRMASPSDWLSAPAYLQTVTS